MEKTTVKWDLSDLYSGMDDPRIEETLATQFRRAEEFAGRYREKIDSPDLSAQMLRDAIEEFEDIQQEIDKPLTYASLIHAADTSDPARGAFLQRMRERHSDIIVRLVFFELELMAVPDVVIQGLAANPALVKYRHYVWAERLFREYRLSEPEEKILEEKANTGRRAFSRLFDQTVAGIPFKTMRDGKEEILTLPEMVNLLRDPDREVRRSAARTLTDGLVSNGPTLTYIFNALLQDKAVDDRLRNHAYPEQSRHLSNELDRETVEVVVSEAIKAYPMVARYYRLKRDILGYDKLTHYDRYAPLFAAEEEVSFDRAKEIVLSSLGEFTPVLAGAASDFFENGWVDAEVRKGKRGGAFCSYVTPDLHPYVFVNYLNKLNDVMTLGHELGHAVHARLAGKQGYLSFSPVLPVAELASIFGEMLVFESLQRQASLQDKLALYASRVEDSFATIFRQAAMFRFEQAIHAARREKGELTTEAFSEIWQARQQEMFGDSVILEDEHKYWWIYVSHFIGSPFYVYAYTFGELLVMALYAMYKKEGSAFVPKYIKLLETGGSEKPAEMLSKVGIDIQDPAFWRGGLGVLEGFIAEFESLYGKWKKEAGK